MIAERRGGAYEPELADVFLADAERLMEGIDGDGRPRDDPGARAASPTRCSTRRPARKPVSPSPT